MIHYADPPIFLDGLIDDPAQVAGLFERAAPYTPLGGWFMPKHEGDRATSAMWFQKDWVHADFALPGSDLFFRNERVIEAARAFYDAEVIVPHTIYVNLMVAIAECGPAHTDNPVFRGRNRTNTPMMLLRNMLWSGLFDRWAITQATSIWWMNDVEGGGLSYWPEGPDKPPAHHAGAIANTALVGDNHGMFHQVEPVGPFDRGTQRVSPAAELGPASDGSGDWVVIDGGRECFRAPFDRYRASVLWKADVYATEDERRRVEHDTLSLDTVVELFNEDLAERGAELRVARDTIEDPALIGALGAAYPEDIPIGKGVSMFEV
jgi:hypothetical protein